MSIRPLSLVCFSVLAFVACDQKAAEKPAEAEKPVEAAKPGEPAKPAALRADKGVDVATKTIKIGALNDESGPAAAIGVPYALGKRILAAEVNAGGSGILPEGWKVELVEKDHGYDPAKSQESFESLKNDVLVFVTSFGTPTTLPLRPFLEKDQIVAFPASLSSQMAEFAYTPPTGPSYVVEAMRAVDWLAGKGDKAKVKAGILYDQTDYGTDGLSGWKKGAAHHGITIAVERAVKPGQKDFTAEVAELKKAGATHVYLAILPSSTGPVLGTAAKLTYQPIWVGATPSWIDAFFAHPKLPAPVFANYYMATGLPYWAEPVPGMDKFLAAFEKHGKALNARPDSYLLMSYLQGRIALEAARRAIEAGDVSRAGYVAALKMLKGYDAGGLLQAVDLSSLPYVTSTKTRILAPDFTKTTWRVEAPYAEPAALGAQAQAPQ
jgi:ABC-type branched-subunit amino acid transport system substrate-binding protein